MFVGFTRARGGQRGLWGGDESTAYSQPTILTVTASSDRFEYRVSFVLVLYSGFFSYVQCSVMNIVFW